MPEALRGFDHWQHQGEAGHRWPAALPDTVAEWCDRWNLEVDGQPMHGYHSLVVPVGRDGEPPALKLTWPDRHTEEQMPALRLWNGLGAVRLVDADIAAAVVGGVGITLHGVWWYTALNHACPPDARGRLHAAADAAAVTRIVEPVGMAGAVPAAALVGVGAVAGLGAGVILLAGSLTRLVPRFSRYGAAGPVRRRHPLRPAGRSGPGAADRR